MSSSPDWCAAAAGGVLGLASMSRLCARAAASKTKPQTAAAHPLNSALRCHLVLDLVGMGLSSALETFETGGRN
jgi:hypothetical protein